MTTTPPADALAQETLHLILDRHEAARENIKRAAQNRTRVNKEIARLKDVFAKEGRKANAHLIAALSDDKNPAAEDRLPVSVTASFAENAVRFVIQARTAAALDAGIAQTQMDDVQRRITHRIRELEKDPSTNGHALNLLRNAQTQPLQLSSLSGVKGSWLTQKFRDVAQENGFEGPNNHILLYAYKWYLEVQKKPYVRTEDLIPAMVAEGYIVPPTDAVKVRIRSALREARSALEFRGYLKHHPEIGYAMQGTDKPIQSPGLRG